MGSVYTILRGVATPFERCIIDPTLTGKGLNMLTFKEKKEILQTRLLRAQSLTTAEKMVGLSLLHKVDDKGECDVRMHELMGLSGLSKSGVYRTLLTLSDKIQLKINRKGCENKYSFYQWRLI